MNLWREDERQEHKVRTEPITPASLVPNPAGEGSLYLGGGRVSFRPAPTSLLGPRQDGQGGRTESQSMGLPFPEQPGSAPGGWITAAGAGMSLRAQRSGWIGC